MWQQLQSQIQKGSVKALARTISLVENEHEGYYQFLQSLAPSSTAVIGITGPPGAGKSTIVDALIEELVKEGKRVGVLCVDPSSPFNLGALLGDRIRMNRWYNHPGVYIRSLATRGSLGGLNPKIIEITDVLKLAPFNHLIIETVGVGQSEIEIAGLADTTVVVVVPEAGDEVQTMKAGLMEIADIFVVNKADREGADEFARNLKNMLSATSYKEHLEIPIIKTIANNRTGIPDLVEKITQHQSLQPSSDRHYWLLAEKVYHLVKELRMKDINKASLKDQIKKRSGSEDYFNIYKFVETINENKS